MKIFDNILKKIYIDEYSYKDIKLYAIKDSFYGAIDIFKYLYFIFIISYILSYIYLDNKLVRNIAIMVYAILALLSVLIKNSLYRIKQEIYTHILRVSIVCYINNDIFKNNKEIEAEMHEEINIFNDAIRYYIYGILNIFTPEYNLFVDNFKLFYNELLNKRNTTNINNIKLDITIKNKEDK